MKRKLTLLGLLPLIVIIFTTQSCEKIKDLVAFDVTQSLPDYHFTLDSVDPGAKEETILYENYFNLNFDSVLKANDFNEGMISDGSFDQVQLAIEEPTADLHFGFVSDLYLRVSLTEDFENSEVMAEAHDIQPGDQSVIFTINNNSLKKYLDNRTFHFRITGNVVEELHAEAINLVMSSKVKFTVKPLK